MIGLVGHVGPKVSALIDGQLSSAESERLWAHVHACGPCRDLVEREGWVKTRLAGLACGSQPTAPNYLRSVLREPSDLAEFDSSPAPGQERRSAVVVLLGAGSVGAALCGVLALALPAQNPPVDRRGPVTSVSTPTGASRPASVPGVAVGFVSAGLGRDASRPSDLRSELPATTQMAQLSLPLSR